MTFPPLPYSPLFDSHWLHFAGRSGTGHSPLRGS